MSWAAIGSSVAGAAVGGILSSKSGNSSQGSNATYSSGSNQTYGNQYSQMTPYPGNDPLYGYLMGQTSNLMQSPVPYYPGQTYVSPSQPTQQGINNLMDTAGSYMGNLGTMLDQIPGQMNLNDFSGATDIANNPYVQGMLGANAKNITNQLQNNWLPNISNQAQQVNALGSSRQGLAQGTAMGQAADALAQANANTMLGAYSQGLNTQLGAQGQAVSDVANYRNNALNQAQMYTQNAWLPSQMMLNAGQSVEGYQNAALQDQMNRYNWMFNEPLQRLGLTQNTLGTTGALNQQAGVTSGYASNASSGSGTNSTYAPTNPLYGAGVGWNLGQSLYNQYGSTVPTNQYSNPTAGYSYGGFVY